MAPGDVSVARTVPACASALAAMAGPLSKEEKKFYDSLGPEKANKQEKVTSIFWEHCVKLGSEDLRAMYSRYHLCSTSQ